MNVDIIVKDRSYLTLARNYIENDENLLIESQLVKIDSQEQEIVIDTSSSYSNSHIIIDIDQFGYRNKDELIKDYKGQLFWNDNESTLILFEDSHIIVAEIEMTNEIPNNTNVQKYNSDLDGVYTWKTRTTQKYKYDIIRNTFNSHFVLIHDNGWTGGIGLIDEDQPYLIFDNDVYGLSKECFRSLSPLDPKGIDQLHFISEIDSRKGVINGHGKLLIPRKYTDIEYLEGYFFCSTSEKIEMYSNNGKRQLRNKIISAYAEFGNEIRLVVNNMDMWLIDDKLYDIDSPPSEDPMLVCGTMEYYLSQSTVDNTTDNYNLTFRQERSHKDIWEKTYLLIPEFKIDSLGLLNSGYSDHKVCKELYGDINFFSENIYFESNEVSGILNSLIGSVVYMEDLEEVPLKKENVIFSVQNGTIELLTNNLIRFSENDLFGIYPLYEKPNFKEIGDFNYGLAPVVTMDNRKGWMDSNGKTFIIE